MMKQQRKNRLFTFLCSFIPGAAEMYMGFMKQGFSMMALVVAIICVMSVLNISDVFMFVIILFWAYSFFHARNVAALDDETFYALEDKYIWEDFLVQREIKISNPALRKWGAAALILAGVVMLWENFSRMLYWVIPTRLWDNLSPLVDHVPQVAIAVVVIIAGLRLMAGKKEEMKENE